MVCLGLVDHQQPPAILEFRPNSRRTSKWITLSSVKKKKKMHSFMSTLLSVLLEADGSEDEKTLSVIVAAAAAAAAAAVFCLAAFVHTSGTSAELTA